MASKTVTCCDVCGWQESEDRKVVRCAVNSTANLNGVALTKIVEVDAEELCFLCASSRLRYMFGITESVQVAPSQPQANGDPPLSDDTAKFLAAKADVMTRYECDDTVPIKPKTAVAWAAGDVVEFGNPPKRVEVLEPWKDKPGLFWVKILGPA